MSLNLHFQPRYGRHPSLIDPNQPREKDSHSRGKGTAALPIHSQLWLQQNLMTTLSPRLKEQGNFSLDEGFVKWMESPAPSKPVSLAQWRL